MGVIRALTKAGFMINLRKCKFLAVQVELLGLQICEGSYRLGDKSLKKWLKLKLPSNLKELQQLLGRMLWASPFVPNYKAIAKPIEALLACKGEARWTQQCTDALNEVARVVFQRFSLAIPDSKLACDLHVSLGESTGAVIIVQGEEVQRAVALLGRRLTKTEVKRCPLE